jgi:hypothetical protein
MKSLIIANPSIQINMKVIESAVAHLGDVERTLNYETTAVRNLVQVHSLIWQCLNHLTLL